jgi:hypothetical protein
MGRDGLERIAPVVPRWRVVTGMPSPVYSPHSEPSGAYRLIAIGLNYRVTVTVGNADKGDAQPEGLWFARVAVC